MDSRELIAKAVKHRKEINITQREVALRTGLSQQAISSLERCDREPRLSNLLKYLEGIDIDINKIFD